MLCAFVQWPPGGMQREAERHEATGPRQRVSRLVPAMSCGRQTICLLLQGQALEACVMLEQPPSEPSLGQVWGSGLLLLPCRETDNAAWRDPTLGESLGDADHKRMRHAGACTMRQDITDTRIIRRLQENGDTLPVIDSYSHRAWSSGTKRTSEFVAIKSAFDPKQTSNLNAEFSQKPRKMFAY